MGGQMNPFSFKKITETEQSKLDKDIREIEDRVKETTDTAKQCLDTETFIRYKASYKLLERQLIDIGIYTKVTSPNEYNALCRKIFSELKVLKRLQDNVEGDAR